MIKGLAEWWDSTMEGEPDPWMTRRDVQKGWLLLLAIDAFCVLTLIYAVASRW